MIRLFDAEERFDDFDFTLSRCWMLLLSRLLDAESSFLEFDLPLETGTAAPLDVDLRYIILFLPA